MVHATAFEVLPSAIGGIMPAMTARWVTLGLTVLILAQVCCRVARRVVATAYVAMASVAAVFVCAIHCIQAQTAATVLSVALVRIASSLVPPQTAFCVQGAVSVTGGFWVAASVSAKVVLTQRVVAPTAMPRGMGPSVHFPVPPAFMVCVTTASMALGSASASQVRLAPSVSTNALQMASICVQAGESVLLSALPMAR